MANEKARRLRALSELLRSDRVSSQEALGERLAASGFRVTQATVSRDLEELGAVKVRSGGEIAYALPGDGSGAAREPRPLSAILGEWALSIASAGNLVVIKTPPGSAHLVGVALDRAALPGVAGTICGDDTLFVALASARSAAATAAQLSRLADG